MKMLRKWNRLQLALAGLLMLFSVLNGAQLASAQTNLLNNAGFESEIYGTQTPSGWSEWSDVGGNTSSYIEGGDNKSGGMHLTHWKNASYRVYTYQVKTGLTNGNYTLRAWAKRSGGQNYCYLEAKDYGGVKNVSLPVSNTYQQITITDINVTNGQCTIGLWSDANANNWAYLDDVEFFKSDGASSRVRKIGTNLMVNYYQPDWVDNKNLSNYYTDTWSNTKDFTNTSLTNPWNTTFLNELKPYQVIRFMDWSSTNGSIAKYWNDRTQKHHKYQGSQYFQDSNGMVAGFTQQDGKVTSGIAWEWMIDLSNRNNSDAWINVPHQTIDPADFPNGTDFNNDYTHKLAILFKTGVDMKNVNLKNWVGSLSNLSAKSRQDFINAGGVATAGSGLNSNLKLYIEYSNEMWMRAQSTYGSQKARQHLGYTWDAWDDYAAYAEIRVFRAFQDVYGSEMGSRVVKVSGYTWNDRNGADQTWNRTYAVTSNARNPWNIKPDAWKWASYISGTYSDNWNNTVENTFSGMADLRSWAIGKGMRFIAYEGGNDLSTGAGDFQQDQNSYAKYKYWLTKGYNTFDLMCHYVHNQRWATPGATQHSWGTLNHTGQSAADAPLYRALKDYSDGN